jgi:hypothetical protein
MAPGGVAAWLGPPPDAALPAGFDWLVLEATESRRLPAAHYRLVIAPGRAATDLGVLLESGGILVVRDTAVADGGLRPVLVDDAGTARLVAYRRVD